MRRPIALACVAGVLAIAGCGSGESEQASAEKSVCEAKAGLTSTVKSLQGMTAETVSISQIQQDIASISGNLSKFAEAESKLNGVRKEQLEKANEELKSELGALKSAITKVNLTEAKAQLTSAAQQLATSYSQALSKVECSSS